MPITVNSPLKMRAKKHQEYENLLQDQKEPRKARSVNKGKQALPFHIYKKRCEKHISDLQERMN